MTYPLLVLENDPIEVAKKPMSLFPWQKIFHKAIMDTLREAPLKKTQGLFGHCPNGGGRVSTLARKVWGTYFEKNCPCSKGHLLGLGGLNPCQDGLGHLCSEN